jgi:hypothetical protein
MYYREKCSYSQFLAVTVNFLQLQSISCSYRHKVDEAGPRSAHFEGMSGFGWSKWIWLVQVDFEGICGFVGFGRFRAMICPSFSSCFSLRDKLVQTRLEPLLVNIGPAFSSSLQIQVSTPFNPRPALLKWDLGSILGGDF